MKISRREFIAVSGACALGSILTRAGSAAGSFRILVVGDSLAWGQGLREQDKFYSITASWIGEVVLAGRREVDLNVKAHSGATIKLSPEEASALKRAGRDEFEKHHPEVNISFPTIEQQVTSALADYGDPNAVDLILVSGCAPEVGVGNILDPFQNDERLKGSIARYCGEHMTELLGAAARSFPRAMIVLVGYYPIITAHTPVKTIVNDVLEVYNWPGWTKPLINNPINRNLLRRYRRRMITRSRIWHEGSTDEFRRAVDRVNAGPGGGRVRFVSSGFGPQNGYGAAKTYLWKVGRKGRAEDVRGEERALACGTTIKPLREETKLKYRTRVCELASIGHPNVKGAAVIADSLRQMLGPKLEERLASK
jgi:hypothetical protein